MGIDNAKMILRKDEYIDVSTNMRAYAALRFAQLTLFITLTASLMGAAFGAISGLDSWFKDAAKFGGVVICILFWIVEGRSTGYYHRFNERALELESRLGFRQYRKQDDHWQNLCWLRKKFTATYAIGALFGIILIFWLMVLCERYAHLARS